MLRPYTDEYSIGSPHVSMDLAARNIQRGRDHGLPGYNAVRQAFGLKRYGSVAEQFTCLRDGDRFWCANDQDLVDRNLIPEIEAILMSDIVRWNTRIRQVPSDIFTAVR